MAILLNFFKEMGGLYLFVRNIHCTWLNAFQRTLPLVFEQICLVAYRSIPTILFSGFFVGAILVIQFQLMLSKYGAVMLLGGLNTSAIVREIGPMIISFLLAGKIGAYTAAELGTMQVTEQIDAIRCLGKNPIEYIIVPRFIAIIFCAVTLLMFGLFFGIIGSILVAHYLYGFNYLQYLQTVPQFTDRWTIISGLFKAFTYGSIVATVSTYMGYNASGGAKGVGRAVTQCAIYTNLFIVFANSATTLFLDSLRDFIHQSWGGIG